MSSDAHLSWGGRLNDSVHDEPVTGRSHCWQDRVAATQRQTDMATTRCSIPRVPRRFARFVFRLFFAVVDTGDGAAGSGYSFVNPPADLFQIPSSVLARHSSALARAFEGAQFSLAQAPPNLQTQPQSQAQLVEPEPESDTELPGGQVEDACADAVIIGGGPNGLFTAIQLSRRCPTMRVVVLEKYNTYQRKHVLKIEASSLETGIDDVELTAALRGLIGKVPTSKIETTFKSLATAAPNVDVRCGVHAQDLDALQSQFPNAKYFVGADGKRSIVRRERFGTVRVPTIK